MSLRCLERVAPPLALLLALLPLALLAGCERETRLLSPPPGESQLPGESPLQGAIRVPVANPYEDNAYAVAQGKRWYRAYNCNGCHGQGGGSSGPALMDAQWRYGADTAGVFASIAQGRPGGMPAYGSRVPVEQLRQLTAYVRSMSGQLRMDVAPSRGDTLQASKPESQRDKETPRPEVPPVAEQR